MNTYIYIYIYICSPPPPWIEHSFGEICQLNAIALLKNCAPRYPIMYM